MRKAIATMIVVWSAAAGAQSAQDKATANSLFDEAKRLMIEGNYAAACPKLETAQRIAPSLGRKMNLGECWMKLGRTASAWSEYREAASMAARAGDDREAFARERAAELEKKLARLTVKISAGADVPGLELKRDGVAMDRGLIGSAVAVDPGSHTVEASAPGRTAWSSKVAVSDGAQITVEIPVLGAPTHYAEPPPTRPGPAVAPPVSPPADRPAPRGRTQRLAGYTVGGVGLAATGVGVAFGLMAKSKRDEARDGHCNADNQCTDALGVSLTRDANTKARNATIALGVGVAGVATGIILVLTAPSGAPAEAHAVAPYVTGDGAGMMVRGSF